jgi:hypothetical protein
MRFRYKHICENERYGLYLAGASRGSLPALDRDLIYDHDTRLLGYEISCGNVSVYVYLYKKPKTPKRTVQS